MSENQVTISQNELDRILTVFSNVQKDNSANEKGATPAGLSLSQDDLDSLYRKGVAAVNKAAANKAAISRAFAANAAAGKSAAPNKTAGTDDIIRLDKPQVSKDEADRIRARKIAERKAHSAQILAQVKADSPCRIVVSYGSCLKKGDEVEKLAAGDTIRLDRRLSENVKVFVDGRLFAEGVLGEDAGMATVKLTKLVSKGGR